MSWTDTNWKYIDGDSAPIPVLAESLYVFDISDIYSIWSFTLESLGLPSPITDIAVMGSFTGMSGLSTVTIPEEVQYIGPYAFYGTSLSSVTISSTAVYFDASFPEGCQINTYPSS